MADYAVIVHLSLNSAVPAYSGGIFVGGVAHLCSGANPGGWTAGQIFECGPLGESANLSAGGNYAIADQTNIVISSGWYTAFLEAGATLIGATVEVGTLSGMAMASKWSGVVVSPVRDAGLLVLGCESITTARHVEIPRRIITEAAFPGVLTEFLGKPVPTIYGRPSGMKPPSIQSERIPSAGCRLWPSSIESVDQRYCTVSQIAGANTSTINTAQLVAYMNLAPSGGGFTGGWIDYLIDSTVDLYAEVVNGTGQGQIRKIIPASVGSVSQVATAANGREFGIINVDFFTPLDDALDETSEILIYRIDRLARFIVGDEVLGVSVYSQFGPAKNPLAHEVANDSRAYIVDLSSEFQSNEGVKSLEYHPSDDNYGRGYLSDLLCASLGQNIPVASAIFSTGPGPINYSLETICPGVISYNSLINKDIKEILYLFSFDLSLCPVNPRAYPRIIVTDFEGNKSLVPGRSLVSDEYHIPDINALAYPKSICIDGVRGGFQAYAYKIDLGIPISRVYSIEYGLALSYNQGVLQQQGGGPSLTVTVSSGSNVVFNVDSASLTPVLPAICRPSRNYPANVIDLPATPTDAPLSITRSGLWRQIVSISGAYITFDDISDWEPGTYEIIAMDPSKVGTALEIECGLALSYGGVSLSSDIRVDAAYGRAYGPHWPAYPTGRIAGDPISKPARAIQDILYRDLGLGASHVDAATFDAVDAAAIDPLQIALNVVQPSDQIIADICRSFNLILSHDATGKEVLTDMFSRLWEFAWDYFVSDYDVIEDSIDGDSMTPIEECFCMPRVSYFPSQAEGYQRTAQVVDLSIAPSLLTEGNYRQFVSGFETSEATALYDNAHIYTIAYNGYRNSGERRSVEIEYPFGGAPFLDGSALLPKRLAWMSQRKRVITFQVPDSDAPAAAYVGQRINLQHRRYAPASGAAVIGTVQATYWIPEARVQKITIICDPANTIPEYDP